VTRNRLAISQTERMLRGRIGGARRTHNSHELIRLMATYAFIALYSEEPETFDDRLALAAFEVFKAYDFLTPELTFEARLALLGLPARADVVLVRLDRGWPPTPAAAVHVTTYNLAALLTGRPNERRPVPGRRTDVASAILEHRPAPLRRLIELDIVDIERYGFDGFEPQTWYPIFAALICRAAAAHGLDLPMRLPAFEN